MKTYLIVPQYLVSQRLVDLASNALRSMKGVIRVSVIDGPAIPGAIEAISGLSEIVIVSEVNEGFAKTCNKGFRHVLELLGEEEAYIGQANDDIEVFDGWLEALTEPFERFENVGVTGLISNKERLIDGVPIEKYQRKKITEGGQLDGWMQSGGCWMSKASILKKTAIYRRV